MPITISDELLSQAGMGEREARIEIACRLFDAGKMTLPLAARLAAWSAARWRDELLDRKIPLYRPTLEDYAQDSATLRELKERR